MDEVLDEINKLIRQEKGNRVALENKLHEAELDSFGTVTLFLELDQKYNYFGDVPDGEDVFTTINFAEITIQEVVDRCILMSTTTK